MHSYMCACLSENAYVHAYVHKVVLQIVCYGLYSAYCLWFIIDTGFRSYVTDYGLQVIGYGQKVSDCLYVYIYIYYT